MDPTLLSGLPLVVSSGIGVFFAVAAALNKWLDSQKNETTQVSILREALEFEKQARKEAVDAQDAAEAKAASAWDKVNALILEQSDMKAQNMVMLEQIAQLRRENQELRANIQEFMRTQNVNVRPNS